MLKVLLCPEAMSRKVNIDYLKNLQWCCKGAQSVERGPFRKGKVMSSAGRGGDASTQRRWTHVAFWCGWPSRQRAQTRVSNAKRCVASELEVVRSEG